MFEFMFIAIWVQNSTFNLLVSQNGINYLSSAMTSPPNIRGIRDVYILGSTVNATQFYIRDLFISNGREYDKDNILVDSNKFFNHACDSFTGVDIQFSVANVLLFSSVAEQTFNAGSGDRYIGQLLNLDVSSKNWYVMFSVKFASWASSSQSFFIYGDGYRGGNPYLLGNLYNPSNSSPVFFLAGRNPGISINITTIPADNTYNDFKLQYTSSNTTYELFINNVSQGTMTATVQTFSIINDILFTPVTNTYVKNVYIYEGTP